MLNRKERADPEDSKRRSGEKILWRLSFWGQRTVSEYAIITIISCQY